ncbi:MAG: hypothetical protein HKO59_04325, partial [Phycisphaerales bacterium]|nr:hypothetical protein [Phycisphaerales bacterium]
MKRLTGLSVIALAATTGTTALAGGPITTDWSDGFDTYELGVDIVGIGGWEHWADDPESFGARVTDATVRSGPQALVVTGDPSGAGDNDAPLRQFAITEGIWDLAIWQFIPEDASFGRNGFILLNQYDHGCTTCNWSAQIVVDAAAGTIESQFKGEIHPYPVGQWNQIRLRINLDSDHVDVFLNDEIIDSRLWTDGNFLGNPGITELAAMTPFGWDADFNGYYDDMTFERVPPIGGCCLPDGTCLDDAGTDDCETAGGVFAGFGSSCAAVTCYELSADGWLVEAPLVWDAVTGHADTCDETGDCDLSSSNDIQWVVTVPRDREYIFSVCGAAFDTVLALGSTPCTDDIAVSDDALGCGTASEFRVELTADGGPYYLTLEGFGGGDCGEFTLQIIELCPLLSDNPKALDEPEPCGDDENGGCNMAVPMFTAIECGDVYRGTAWREASGGTRDTDWYELILTEPAEVTITGQSESDGTVFGLVNTGGSGNCADATAITPFATSQPCFEAAATVTTTLEPGTWWVFAAQPFGDLAVPCDDHAGYELTLACGPSVDPCPEDLDDSGDVGFSDLLAVLANWGPCPGCPEDLDGSGDVGFADLLSVLANWGP